MDLDFITKLLGGKGNNAMTMLLPLLLGGRSFDFSSVLGALTKQKPQGDSEAEPNSYPPLFGMATAQTTEKQGDIMQFFGQMIPSSVPKQEEKQRQEYPYELQYNRPYSAEKMRK